MLGARVAARAGDWDRVDQIIAILRTEARSHPWLLASLEQLKVLAAGRETKRFSKESFFKSLAMRERLAGSDESIDFAAAQEVGKPTYLRRKPSLGKRFDKDTDPLG